MIRSTLSQSELKRCWREGSLWIATKGGSVNNVILSDNDTTLERYIDVISCYVSQNYPRHHSISSDVVDVWTDEDEALHLDQIMLYTIRGAKINVSADSHDGTEVNFKSDGQVHLRAGISEYRYQPVRTITQNDLKRIAGNVCNYPRPFYGELRGAEDTAFPTAVPDTGNTSTAELGFRLDGDGDPMLYRDAAGRTEQATHEVLSTPDSDGGCWRAFWAESGSVTYRFSAGAVNSVDNATLRRGINQS